MNLLRRATRDELRFAYDLGRAHQLLEERLGENNQETSFAAVLEGVWRARL